MLVCTADSPEWHQERLKVVTGTWVPVVMGLSPYKSHSDAVAHYLGNSKFVAGRHAWWGRASEEANLMALGKMVPGLDVVSDHGFHVSASVGATLDGRATLTGRPVCDRADAPMSAPTCWRRDLIEPLQCLWDEGHTHLLIELKQTDERNRRYWKEVPEHYWAQVQAQLFTTESEYAIIFCRIGAADCRAHVIEADPLFHEEMVVKCGEFLEEVTCLKNQR